MHLVSNALAHRALASLTGSLRVEVFNAQLTETALYGCASASIENSSPSSTSAAGRTMAWLALRPCVGIEIQYNAAISGWIVEDI